MSEREHMSQERMEAVRNNLDSFKFCASWFHNLLDEAQRLSREATALRQQRDRLREALRIVAEWKLPRTGRFHPDGTEQSYGWAYGSNGERDFMRDIARAALAQCDAQEGV